MHYIKVGAKHYEIEYQVKDQSCTAACAVMALKMTSGGSRSLSQSDFLTQTSQYRGPGEYDKFGASEEHIVSVLQKWKVKATSHKMSEFNNLISAAGESSPLLLGMSWKTGSRHMIVTPGLNEDGDSWVALDPWFGGSAQRHSTNNKGVLYEVLHGGKAWIDSIIFAQPF